MPLSSVDHGPIFEVGVGPLDPDSCREQLKRIVSSDGFDASDRNRRFLSFVVEEALKGRADRIKAYTVAVEVFGRDSSFDPQTDPIVRVEAGQLRRALERYYLDTGRADPIEISIPKGGYAPKFASRMPEAVETPLEPASVAAERPVRKPAAPALGLLSVLAIAVIAGLWAFVGRGAAPSQPDLPRLLVQTFDDLSETPGSTAIAQGLTQEVISQIAKFRDIIVLPAQAEGQTGSQDAPPFDSPARYALVGSVDIEADTVRLQARVISREEGSVLWANSYSGDRSVERMSAVERDIAEKVATAVGQTYGVIFQADKARQVRNPSDGWTAYACTLSYYDYRISLDAKVHPGVRTCLKDAVARFPNYATAWALLALVYIDEVRFRFAPDPVDGPAPVQRAVEAAAKAVALDPQNVRALQAQMFALFFSGDTDAAIRVGRQALAVNPNDTELRGEVGYRLALAGSWEEGCDLVARARGVSPGPAGYYESALALCAYQRGDLEAATMWVGLLLPNDNPQYHLIAAAIYGESGNPAATGEIEWLRVNAPHLYTNSRREISLRVARTEDVDRFMASLAKAGLPTGD